MLPESSSFAPLHNTAIALANSMQTGKHHAFFRFLSILRLLIFAIL
jgi:hypothetical protein